MRPSLLKTLFAAANAVWYWARGGVADLVRIRPTFTIGLAVVIGAIVIEIPIGQSAVYHVDVNNPGCSNAPGFGSESKPYCTLRYVSTVAVPGDTFLINSGRYGDGPAAFRRSGTATAPITYRAIGDVVIGSFDDVRDEDFRPTQYPNVYALAWTNLLTPGRVHQTYFDSILVDNPNPSIFTMRQEDGPLALTVVTDFTVLAAHEGTWLSDTTTGKLYVHPYGDRVPSTAGTDFVVGLRGAALSVDATAQYNVFDGFRIAYGGLPSTFLVLSKNNRFLNLTFQATPWSLRGSDNYSENITVTHVIERGRTWEWHSLGAGSAIGVMGAGHIFKNVHLYHNWNSSISGERALGMVVDRLRVHGAPNHCGVVGGKNGIVRNAVTYNCQDYFYLHQTDNALLEHVVTPQGISLQGLTGPVGKVTVRNSILNGFFGFTSRSKAEHCAWESGSLLENNIISPEATIERCADGKAYPILEYMAKCESGAFTGCMTIRNNKLVSDFKTVIRGGRWNAALGDEWDVSLVTNSPAIDAGTVSGATEDLLGVSRPQGAAFDIGVYEFCGFDCSRTQRAPKAPIPFGRFDGR